MLLMAKSWPALLWVSVFLNQYCIGCGELSVELFSNGFIFKSTSTQSYGLSHCYSALLLPASLDRHCLNVSPVSNIFSFLCYILYHSLPWPRALHGEDIYYTSPSLIRLTIVERYCAQKFTHEGIKILQNCFPKSRQSRWP